MILYVWQMSRTGILETESKLMVSGARVSGFCEPTEMFSNYILAMVTHLCDYTKNHWAINFKLVNFMVLIYEVYLKKAIKKKSEEV